MCYIYAVGVKATELQYIELVNDAIEQKILADDCTVINAELYLKWLTGRNFNVTKFNISKLSDVKSVAPVRYDYNGHSHWVVVKDGKIVFNSLKESVCVKKGKPTTARIISKV